LITILINLHLLGLPSNLNNARLFKSNIELHTVSKFNDLSYWHINPLLPLSTSFMYSIVSSLEKYLKALITFSFIFIVYIPAFFHLLICASSWQSPSIIPIA